MTLPAISARARAHDIRCDVTDDVRRAQQLPGFPRPEVAEVADLERDYPLESFPQLGIGETAWIENREGEIRPHHQVTVRFPDAPPEAVWKVVIQREHWYDRHHEHLVTLDPGGGRVCEGMTGQVSHSFDAMDTLNRWTLPGLVNPENGRVPINWQFVEVSDSKRRVTLLETLEPRLARDPDLVRFEHVQQYQVAGDGGAGSVLTMRAQNAFLTRAAKENGVNYDRLTVRRRVRSALRRMSVLERIARKNVDISLRDHADRIRYAVVNEALRPGVKIDWT